MVERGNAPLVDTLAAVGLKPVRPHKAEGIRTDPPVSVPIAAAAILSVTDTAAPLDEPPGILPIFLSHGFKGVP